MSSEFAIEVTNLGKCYQIYDKPSDRLKQMLFRDRRQYYKEFWALKDVSFKVKKGETVGIIGRNGSGKSTLLQMICGTLNPTSGEIKVNGRVAALLELGAGFNPEFTGVENVYMAASLYGLSKEETNQRFEAIAAFADIGDHIYQPVKTYSSGMFVRLAFAVIAHVDADILVIDEALSVGDAVFTQKCMRFIRKFKESGTLLFVSHDMGSVLNLCELSVWLHMGEIRQIGKAKEVSELYLQFAFQEACENEFHLQQVSGKRPTRTEEKKVIFEQENSSILNYEAENYFTNNLLEADGWKTGGGEITSVDFDLTGRDLASDSKGVFQGDEMVCISICAKANRDMSQPILGFLVRDRLGQDLFGENTLSFTSFQPLSIIAGESLTAQFEFKMPMLPNGDYTVMVSFAEGTLENHVQHHWLHNALLFKVSSSKVRWGLVGVSFSSVDFFKTD